MGSHAINVADPSGVAHIVTVGADTNNVAGRADITASAITYCDVEVAGTVAKERGNTDGRVAFTVGIALKRSIADSSVGKAFGVERERERSSGCIVLASGIV